MNNNVPRVLSLIFVLSIPINGHGNEAYEYSDEQLISAGWSQSQIDNMRANHKTPEHLDNSDSKKTISESQVVTKSRKSNHSVSFLSPDRSEWSYFSSENTNDMMYFNLQLTGDKAIVSNKRPTKPGNTECVWTFRKQKNERNENITANYKLENTSRGCKLGSPDRFKIHADGDGEISPDLLQTTMGDSKIKTAWESGLFDFQLVDKCQMLVRYAFQRNTSMVRKYLQQGVDINCIDGRGKTALLASLLRSGANSADTHRTTKYLVDSGADVNLPYHHDSTVKNVTPSFLAAYKGYFDSAAYIVEHGGSFEDAERGYRRRESDNALALATLAAFAGLVEKGTEMIGESMKKGHEFNEAERARLNVAEQFGVYKIEREDNYTYVYCNRAPTVANKMVRQDNGLCYNPPAIGAYDCLEVLESLKKQCE